MEVVQRYYSMQLIIITIIYMLYFRDGSLSLQAGAHLKHDNANILIDDGINIMLTRSLLIESLAETVYIYIYMTRTKTHVCFVAVRNRLNRLIWKGINTHTHQHTHTRTSTHRHTHTGTQINTHTHTHRSRKRSWWHFVRWR